MLALQHVKTLLNYPTRPFFDLLKIARTDASFTIHLTYRTFSYRR